MIEGPTPGVWRVETASGATYLLDFAAMTLARRMGHDGNVLRKDSETVPLVCVLKLHEGEPMGAIVDVRGDGVLTIRTTTTVQSITFIEREDD